MLTINSYRHKWSDSTNRIYVVCYKISCAFFHLLNFAQFCSLTQKMTLFLDTFFEQKMAVHKNAAVFFTNFSFLEHYALKKV